MYNYYNINVVSSDRSYNTTINLDKGVIDCCMRFLFNTTKTIKHVYIYIYVCVVIEYNVPISIIYL